MSLNWRQYLETAGLKSAGSGEAASKKKKPDAVQRKFQAKLKQDKVSSNVSNESVVEKSVTRVVALDCEMVGVQDGKESILARVSVVNSYGYCLYDTFVKPTEDVVDYRTSISGVRPNDMERGVEFSTAQKAVAELLKGRLLVGHAVRNDLRVLYLSHPKKRIRDTSKYRPFRRITNGNTPSLKRLAKEILGIKLQEGEHSSVEDAKAAMLLYNMYKTEWETNKSHK